MDPSPLSDDVQINLKILPGLELDHGIYVSQHTGIEGDLRRVPVQNEYAGYSVREFRVAGVAT